MEFLVLIYPAEEGGYWAKVPALPGCYSQGESIEEVLSNVREAIAAHIEALAQDGQEPPEDTAIVVGRVEVTL